METNEKMQLELKKELIRIGSTRQADYDLLKSQGHLSSSAICRRLDTPWREVIEQVGLKPARVLLPREDMLEALLGEFERLGSFKKDIYREQRNKKLFPFPRVLIEHLGMSWAEIISECGCDDLKKVMLDTVSDEELIHEYKSLSNELGMPASVQELKDATVYTYDIYRQHFGTMGKLRQICGFNVKTKRTTPIITKEDCNRELSEIYAKYGRLSFSQLKDKSSISMTTLFRKFHTTKINEIWNEVLDSKDS